MRTPYAKLVLFTGVEPRNENLPHARLGSHAHRVASSVPGVEIPDHGNTSRIGGPYSETRSGDRVDVHCLGTERAPEFIMGALSDEMQIELAQQQPEGIGVLDDLRRLRPGYAKAVA